ncbi:MAG: general secretion pathway protein GspB [Alphaproteobacteria bacterium]|uniref:General secretion pathway protein GspB n=1 Tax=Candidatus Nitrobium versatile TaxID=2884831 RepID=A0A953JBA4_9BACT|nr:general secretion pathway protein GspB [Candidatus Nitrobium versatile]
MRAPRPNALSERSMLLFLSLPVCVVVVVSIVFSSLKMKPSLSPAEKSLSAFSPDAVKAVPVRQPLTVSSLDSPLSIPRTAAASLKKEFPSTPLAQLAPQQSLQERIDVSLVLVNGLRRMAIINGIVVKEGDMIHAGKVERIGRDGIMIKSGKESRWIKVE